MIAFIKYLRKQPTGKHHGMRTEKRGCKILGSNIL